MKKKIKIFSTIASLCLAVALMAFGVYAASKISFTATSTITFTATDIDGYWTLQIAGGLEADAKTAKDWGEYKDATPVVTSNGTEDNGATLSETIEGLAANIASGESITYTLVFTNTGDSSATAVVSAEATAALPAGWTLTVDGGTEEVSKPAVKGSPASFEVVISTVAGQDADANLNLSKDSSVTFTITADAAITAPATEENG